MEKMTAGDGPHDDHRQPEADPPPAYEPPMAADVTADDRLVTAAGVVAIS
jgi:hypothetical protein